MSRSGLNIHSVEQSCTPHEAADLLRLMDTLVDGSDGIYEVSGRRDASVHEIPGHTAREAGSVEEPKGRIECRDLPAEAKKILEDIFDRSLPSIQYAYPEAARNNGWFYVDYRTGQFVYPTSTITVEPGPVGSSSSSRAATAPFGRNHVSRGADWSTPSFREQRRVRWTAQTNTGDMLIWAPKSSTERG